MKITNLSQAFQETPHSPFLIYPGAFFPAAVMHLIFLRPLFLSFLRAATLASRFYHSPVAFAYPFFSDRLFVSLQCIAQIVLCFLVYRIFFRRLSIIFLCGLILLFIVSIISFSYKFIVILRMCYKRA